MGEEESDELDVDADDADTSPKLLVGRTGLRLLVLPLDLSLPLLALRMGVLGALLRETSRLFSYMSI